PTTPFQWTLLAMH
ncbi:alpha amylase, catalytic domain protein, partial [Vibrio parahaemolyticus V-223/04]